MTPSVTVQQFSQGKSPRTRCRRPRYLDRLLAKSQESTGTAHRGKISGGPPLALPLATSVPPLGLRAPASDGLYLVMHTEDGLIGTEHLVTISNRTGTDETTISSWINAVAGLAYRYTAESGDYSTRTFWRGQSRPWVLSPGIHRVLRDTRQWGLGQNPFNDASVSSLTRTILNGARALGICPPQLRGVTDMQLLAYLQHQGAATPLLDFSSDVMTALAMACFDRYNDQHDGVLFCYRYRPNNAAWVRPFTDFDAAAAFGNGASPYQVNLFAPPYLTSRQRIQRGSLLFSAVSGSNAATTTGINIMTRDEVDGRLPMTRTQEMNANTHPIPDGQCVAIRMPSSIKERLREWLRIQHQLDEKYVFPEPLSSDAYREFVESCSAASLIRSDKLPPW